MTAEQSWNQLVEESERYGQASILTVTKATRPPWSGP